MKEFKSHPVRPIRLSEEVWDILRKQKNKSEKTWNNFIKDLLKQKK